MTKPQTAQYAIFVTDRGGQRRFGSFPKISRVTWSRVRDDISQAVVNLIDITDDVRTLLAEVHTVRHELEIVREGQTVWQGPITLIEANQQSVTITARDVLWYASRFRLEQTLDYAYPNVTSAITAIDSILRLWCGAPDTSNYNVEPYLTPITGPSDPQTSMTFPGYTMTVWEVLDKFGEDGGVDYVVVGRRILWWDVQLRAAIMRPLSDADFLGLLTTVEYGSELVTRGTTVNNEGVKREFTAPQEWIDFYGYIDKVVASQDQDGDGQADTAVITSATRMVNTSLPAPVRVRVPENVPLARDTGLTFDDLIPGTWAQITATKTPRPLSAWHKLDKVQVSFEQGVETINVTFIPGTATVVDLP